MFVELKLRELRKLRISIQDERDSGCPRECSGIRSELRLATNEMRESYETMRMLPSSRNNEKMETHARETKNKFFY